MRGRWAVASRLLAALESFHKEKQLIIRVIVVKAKYAEKRPKRKNEVTVELPKGCLPVKVAHHSP